MIVWINGAFGAGKTATAQELIDLLPNSTLYDPELIGDGVRRLLPPKRLAEVSDYQDLPMWRRLVVDTAAAMLAEVGGVLVVPMSLLRQEYRDEIFGGLAARRIPVRQVLLRPDETILRARIAAREEPPAPRPDTDRPASGTDEGPGGAGVGEGPGGEPGRAQWSYDRIEPYRAALEWLTRDAYTIDTSALDPRGTARLIADALRTGAAAVCEIVQTPEPTAETLAAGVLLFDDEDRVLLVDPTYKPGWEFPGGVVEHGEAPARAGMREVAEELGIELDRVPRLLVADWEPPRPPGYGGLRLLFDGGRLDRDEAGRVLLPGAELRDWRFVGEQEAQRLLPPLRYERLRWALRARERGTALYLEAGVPF
ncbi:NUDIX hydrolase [Streptomyces katsurahamanus]|uniref:NUDIX domain-containing protein n=1 Tax=Streptomyces katsurahamanus TaxID=2577098 RepID=A0ABW9NSE1_9ACTN|nr:NUDIX domain-containing protein [Streptomyces katsurahamanus]MQS35784.1 NUDIX domain-containing protein [Streptomyces katsurahamanus]